MTVRTCIYVYTLRVDVCILRVCMLCVWESTPLMYVHYVFVYVHHVCMFTFALLDIITFAIKISITCTTYKPRHINNGLISVPPLTPDVAQEDLILMIHWRPLT